MITVAIVDAIDECAYNRLTFDDEIINQFVTSMQSGSRKALINALVGQLSKTFDDNLTNNIINQLYYSWDGLLPYLKGLENFDDLYVKNDDTHKYEKKSDTDLKCKHCGFDHLMPQHFPYHEFDPDPDDTSENPICRECVKLGYNNKTKYNFQHYKVFGYPETGGQKYKGKKFGFFNDISILKDENTIEKLVENQIKDLFFSKATPEEIDIMKERMEIQYKEKKLTTEQATIYLDKTTDQEKLDYLRSLNIQTPNLFMSWIKQEKYQSYMMIKNNIINVLNTISNSMKLDMDEIFKKSYGVSKNEYIVAKVESVVENYKYPKPLEFGDLYGRTDFTDADQLLYLQYFEEYFNINRIFVPNLTDEDIIALKKMKHQQRLKKMRQMLNNLKSIVITIGTFSSIVQATNFTIQSLSVAQSIANAADDMDLTAIKNLLIIQKWQKQQKEKLEREKARLEAIEKIKNENQKTSLQNLKNSVTRDVNETNREIDSAKVEAKNLLEKLKGLKQNGSVKSDEYNVISGETLNDNTILSSENPAKSNLVVYIIVTSLIVIVLFISLNFVIDSFI